MERTTTILHSAFLIFNSERSEAGGRFYHEKTFCVGDILGVLV